MPKPKVRTCRKCGCTDARACPGGCFWVAADLCSECQPSTKGMAKKLSGMGLAALDIY